MDKTTGLIGFSVTKGFISKAIQFFRGDCIYSHTFVVFGPTAWGDDIVGEAGTFEVDLVPLKKYAHKDYRMELWEIDLSDVDPEKIKQASLKLTKMVGKTYGYLQLVGFIWVWLLSKFGWTVNNPFEGGVICSEYVFYFLKEIGYPMLNELGLDANNVAPDHLRMLLMADPAAKIVAHSDYGEGTITWEE